VARLIGLDALLAGPPSFDVVVTGEGSLDDQTLLGKAPWVVAQLARKSAASVVAVCGRCELDGPELAAAGFADVLTLPRSVDLDAPAREHCAAVREVGADMGRLLGER
jgi:glycerate kinase